MSHTPWGRVQSSKSLKTGISIVSAASHGGLRISSVHLNGLSEFAKSQAAEISDQYGYWEHDNAWALPAFELKLWDIGLSTKEQTLMSLAKWFPEYANHSESFLKEVQENEKLKEVQNKAFEDMVINIERLRRVRECDPNLIVAARLVGSVKELSDIVSPVLGEDLIKMSVNDLNSLGIKTNERSLNMVESKIAKGELCLVWTADSKVHLVEGYKNRHPQLNKLTLCYGVHLTAKAA